MRVRLFTFAIIFLVTLFQMPFGFSITNKIQQSSLSLTQKAEVEFTNLERNLIRVGSDCQKFDLIEKSLLRIGQLRTEFPIQFKGDEKVLLGRLKKIEKRKTQHLSCRL